jgi:signal recognition particle GTPase
VFCCVMVSDVLAAADAFSVVAIEQLYRHIETLN